MNLREKMEAQINELTSELEATRRECNQLRTLLRRIHTATKQFYEPKEAKPDNCPYDKIVECYRQVMVTAGFPDIRAIGDKRKVKMRKMWQKHLTELDDWAAYFNDARTKPFLLGKNDRGWKADFDFFLREDVLLKIQEGKYND